MEGGRERRAAKRVSYPCEVECEGSGISRLATRINDVSITGAFIDCRSSFPVGSTVTMRYRVRSTQVIADAEVRYCMPQIGMGVRFLNLKPEYLDAIQSVVEEAAK
jgi:hypothetical protein